MPMGDATLADELLPAHLRRVGRIESLHEFHQRTLSYSSDDNRLLVSEDAFGIDQDNVDVHAVENTSNGRYHTQTTRRHGSFGSLFGGAERHIVSKHTFYGRQVKVLSLLILLGVIGGPLNYSIRL